MLRTWVEDSIISLVKIHTDSMVADIMTKVLPVAAFRRHRASLMGSIDTEVASVSGVEDAARRRGRRSGAQVRAKHSMGDPPVHPRQPVEL